MLKPEGPYKDHLGKPLIDKFHNGAQPIDQFVFRDKDGSYYIIYGGWRHCNIAKLNDDFIGLIPFEDGTILREITPEKYVEGPFMFLKDGCDYPPVAVIQRLPKSRLPILTILLPFLMARG